MSAYKPYPKYKPSGVEWLGDVPEGWVLRPLKFFATFRGGATPSKDNVEFWNGDIPWVSPKDMKRARISDSIDHITEDAILQSSTSRIGVDNLLMVVRSGILQHTIPVAINDVAVTLNQDMRAVAPSRQCKTVFLYYWFVGNNAPLLLELGKQGATVESIEQEYLANTRILLPPLPEQHQIAAFLDRECGKLDALQAKQERLIELLKEKRQALISHAVTRGLDPTAKLKPSGIEWLGEVPVHWRTLKLGHVCKLQGGFAFKADEFGDEGIPVIRMKNLSRGNLDMEEVARVPVTSTNTSVALRAGDLLWGMSGSVGDTGSLGNYAVVSTDDLPAQLNQRVGRFLPNTSKLLNDFLCRAIQASSFYEQILLEVTGTAQFNVSSSQVESCYIALPPIAEQRAIVAHLDEKCGKIDQLKAKAERGIELLKERRSALISAAVTGKIDVRQS